MTTRREGDMMRYQDPSNETMKRWSSLNFVYCWSTGRNKQHGTNWEQVNRHLWRIKAMYSGGDVFLAGFPNALPHQRLFPAWQLGQRHKLPAYR